MMISLFDAMNYYNEFDRKAAAWLQELINGGHIPPGHIDTRSITDVTPSDLSGFTQCHFFAGIGGWPLAFRMAGWPDDKPGWSGSAPCQPYSVGNVAHGGAKGQADPRHLLPKLLSLVEECKPPVLFGEQVANAIKWGWLDEAFRTLEALGYACGAAVIPALAVGAMHERKRIFFVADSGSEGREGHQPLKRFSISAQTSLSIHGNPLAGARRALDGDLSHLLPCYGVSVQLARDEVKGYGNAIVPQVAAEFIQAFEEAKGVVNL